MVQRLKKQHPEVPVSFKLKTKAATLIINALDNDNNGTIEPEEFVQWVLKGAKKTRAERREFAASGEEFKVLVQFLEVVIQTLEKSTWIKESRLRLKPLYFHEASENSEEIGHVNADDLTQMVDKLRKRYPSVNFPDMSSKSNTANLIITSLDNGENGTVEVDEWVPWRSKASVNCCRAKNIFGSL